MRKDKRLKKIEENYMEIARHELSEWFNDKLREILPEDVFKKGPNSEEAKTFIKDSGIRVTGETVNNHYITTVWKGEEIHDSFVIPLLNLIRANDLVEADHKKLPTLIHTASTSSRGLVLPPLNGLRG